MEKAHGHLYSVTSLKYSWHLFLEQNVKPIHFFVVLVDLQDIYLYVLYLCNFEDKLPFVWSFI